MDYTQSDAYVTHVGTGHRMHQDTAPISTAVSAADMNMVTWSLMELLNAAGISPAAFDPNTAASYQKLMSALGMLYTGVANLGSTADPTKGAALVGVNAPSGAMLDKWLAYTYGYNILNEIPVANWAAISAGTSTYDCGPAFIAAFVKSKFVVVPQGKYEVVSGNFTMPVESKLLGMTSSRTGGVGGSCDIWFRGGSASESKITVNRGCEIENIKLQAVGTHNTGAGTETRALNLVDYYTLRNVGIFDFPLAKYYGATVFYAREYDVEVNRCSIANRQTATIYNLNWYGAIIRSCDTPWKWDAGVLQLAMFGGSIERFQSFDSFKVPQFSSVSCTDVYFEATTPTAGAISLFQVNNSSTLVIRGGKVYLAFISRFVNASGATNATIHIDDVMWTKSAAQDTADIGAGITTWCVVTPTSGMVTGNGGSWQNVSGTATRFFSNDADFGSWNVQAPIGHVATGREVAFHTGYGAIQTKPLTAAPSTPVSGQMYRADGVSWNPEGISLAVPYWVEYTGSQYRALGRFNGPEASVVFDPPSLAAGATQQTTVTVTGAFVGDYAVVSFSLAHPDIYWVATFTSTNTATVTQINRGVGAVDLASGTLRVRAMRG